MSSPAVDLATPRDEPQALSAGQRAECAVCADWLATGAQCSQAAALAVVAALLGVAAGDGLVDVLWMLAALLLVTIGECVLALRVALDARLFRRLASGELATLAALDHGLQAVLSVPAAKQGRALAPRIQGAMRLYRGQMLATGILWGLNVLAWWPAWGGVR